MKPARSSHYDVIIVGAAMVGMCQALALAKQGLRVGLVDKITASEQSSDDYDGRTLAISLSSQRLLDKLGVWPDLSPYAEPIRHIRVADGNIQGIGTSPLNDSYGGISPLKLDFMRGDALPYLTKEERGQGSCFGWIIENRQTLRQLHLHCQMHPLIDMVLGEAVKDYTPPRLSLASGKFLTAPLVIAADGRHSVMRRLGGIGVWQHQTKQTAMVTTLGHVEDHQGVAVELFLPNGPFAMLPMTKRRMNIVWSEESECAKAILSLSQAEQLAEISKRFGDWLGLLSLQSPLVGWPLSLQLAKSLMGARLVLIGDAAHAIHPVAGQGFNLGLRDVAVLSDIITSAKRRGEDTGASYVLQRYQDERQADIQQLAYGCEALVKLFSNRNPIISRGRRLGLAMINQLPMVRQRLVKQAMGLGLDPLPSLMRGND